MTTLPEPDEAARAARALAGPVDPPDEEVLEAVHDGLVKVPVPPKKPFLGVPRQYSRPARSPLSPRRRRNG